MSSVAVIEQELAQEQGQDLGAKRRLVRVRRLMRNLLTVTLLVVGLVLAGWSSSGLLTKW